MKLVMLDTDILSEFFRGNVFVAKHIGNYLSEYPQLNLSIITYYEILNGLLYKDAKKQLAVFYKFIEANNVLPMTIHSVNSSAEIHANLRKSGSEIGHTDTLIAGIAIANDMQLATNNAAHFSRIKNLRIVNWMA